MLNRFNRQVYYCRRLAPGDEAYQEGVDLFEAPVLRRLNVRPVSGEAVLVSGGELSQKTLVAKLPIKSLDVYYENDRLFVYASPPDNSAFDPADPKADYRVTSVLQGFSVIEIILERMV